MSNISTVIDRLRVLIPTLSRFAGKAELQYTIDVERNNNHQLEDGWGLRIEDSSLSPGQRFNSHMETRSIGIVMSKRSMKRESDVDSSIEDQLSLMEDHNQVTIELLKADQLSIDGSLVKVDFISNSGIELIRDNKKSFIYTVTTISVDIEESTSC